MAMDAELRTSHKPGPGDPGEMPVEPDEGPVPAPTQPDDPAQPIAPPH